MQHNLYREEIIEHYRYPQNFGILASFTTSSKQLNPFCGDEIELFISVMKDSIEEISFRGKGCAISIAAASLLTEFVKQKKIATLTKMTENDMLDILGIDVSETRKKCALLAFAVLNDCLLEVKS